jgi:hypothetical protein
MKNFHWLKCILIAVLITSQSLAQQIAFPGAEGAGRFASGGRGTAEIATTVFEVTNLTDVNAPGSLRYACAQSVNTYPYRTIVFKVSGTIHLASKLNIPRNTTIAGQTAPGDGICLADYPVVIGGDNVIIRYIRIRMGDRFQLKTNPANCGVPASPFADDCRAIDGSGGDDALGDLGHKNIIIDHCSISWSTDEALTMYRGDSLTLQWNVISEPLNYSYHYESPDNDFQQHGYGGIWGALRASFHHNLIAHCRNRTPRFGGNSTYPAGSIESADFRNNVLYNWGINNIYGGDGGQYNLVNNYYKYGPNTSSGVRSRIVGVDSSVAFGYAKYYISGNYVDGSSANTINNWSGASMNTGVAADTVRSKSNIPFLSAYLPATFHTALQAYDTVLKAAGCSLPNRDTLDKRIINNVKNRTGRIIDVQGGFAHGTPYSQTVDAWPYLASITAPLDTDKDGMPDEWEIENGLNPNNAVDRGEFSSNGYTNLENYLNSIQGSNEEDPEEPTNGNTAAATWTLLDDEGATVDGGIEASSQELGSALTGLQYRSTFGSVPGWQRVGSQSYLPIGFDANSYVEYKLKPAQGKVFTATTFEMGALGGGTGTAKMALYYSLDNFQTSLPLGACSYNGQTIAGTMEAAVSLLNTSTTPLTGQQIATIPIQIKVQPTQTLSVRVYVWITGSGNRYFASQNVKINGTIADPVLPLQLARFSAGVAAGSTNLHWQIAPIIGLSRFEIERSSDGVSFKSIGTIDVANSSFSQFAFTDKGTQNGTSYYRLKIFKIDGSFSYSHAIIVERKQTNKLAVYPNPVGSNITVLHNSTRAQALLTIFTIDGKRIETMALIPNTTQTSFSTRNLTKGHYQIEIKNGGESQFVKFVKL